LLRRVPGDYYIGDRRPPRVAAAPQSFERTRMERGRYRRVMMLTFAALYAVAVLVATLVLGASLFLVEDRKESSFKIYGAASTFLRCAGICLGTTIGPFLVFAEDPAPVRDGSISNIPGVTPLWALVAMVVWFAGVIGLFKKTPLQALLLLPVNAAFGLGIFGGIRFWLIHYYLNDAG
jgi:hypothetical protein